MQNLYAGTKKIYTIFLDIFFPVKCLSCHAYGEIVCLKCAKKIEMVKTPTCPDCGRISPYSRFCKNCRSRRDDLALRGIVVATHYDAGPVKEMIHHLKYSGFVMLSEHLGELICQQVASQFPMSDFVVVPVPLFKSRQNSRGFNQSELIARYVSAKLDLPGGDALARLRDTDRQVDLPRKKRLKNVENAFVCQDSELIAGQKILLIDDVATTGATLNECAKALKKAGAKEVWGAVVAKNI